MAGDQPVEQHAHRRELLLHAERRAQPPRKIVGNANHDVHAKRLGGRRNQVKTGVRKPLLVGISAPVFAFGLALQGGDGLCLGHVPFIHHAPTRADAAPFLRDSPARANKVRGRLATDGVMEFLARDSHPEIGALLLAVGSLKLKTRDRGARRATEARA
jgi:hypothetical protein